MSRFHVNWRGTLLQSNADIRHDDLLDSLVSALALSSRRVQVQTFQSSLILLKISFGPFNLLQIERERWPRKSGAMLRKLRRTPNIKMILAKTTDFKICPRPSTIMMTRCCGKGRWWNQRNLCNAPVYPDSRFCAQIITKKSLSFQVQASSSKALQIYTLRLLFSSILVS